MSEGVYFRNLTGEEAEKMLALTEGMEETQLDERSSHVLVLPLAKLDNVIVKKHFVV